MAAQQTVTMELCNPEPAMVGCRAAIFFGADPDAWNPGRRDKHLETKRKRSEHTDLISSLSVARAEQTISASSPPFHID